LLICKTGHTFVSHEKKRTERKQNQKDERFSEWTLLFLKKNIRAQYPSVWQLKTHGIDVCKLVVFYFITASPSLDCPLPYCSTALQPHRFAVSLFNCLFAWWPPSAVCPASMPQCSTCSLSLWRVVRGIKLTYLASRIHGLFITKTQFRLLYTFDIRHHYCSLSLWRVARGSKHMSLELIHGLFIT
jgi:hypothetical protein